MEFLNRIFGRAKVAPQAANRTRAPRQVHKVRDRRTTEEDGLESLFPGCDARWHSRRWQLPRLVVNAGVVRAMTGATSGASFSNGSHDGRRRQGGVLLARIKDFQESGTVRIVDYVPSTGEAFGAWRRDNSVERTILRWYAQNVPGVFFAGQWQSTPSLSLFHPPQTVGPMFDGLVRGGAGLGVPVAVWLTVAWRQSQTRPAVASEMEFCTTASLGAFLWQSGQAEAQQVPVTIDRQPSHRLQPSSNKTPWYIRHPAQFAFEWKCLSTFAGHVNVSFLPEQRAIFTLSDPSWLDRLILVTPNDYPRGEPAVLVYSGDGANDQLKPIDLSALGIQWSRESLLVRILYALERQSGPDPRPTTAQPGTENTNGSQLHDHKERKESKT